MFVYLSKKVAIPNNTRLECIAWSKEQGYIACGGEDGLLKILKLESGKDTKAKSLSAPSNLSMNQTLEGHGGSVQVVTWNEGSQLKLTSSDQNGLIVVWMLYKGSWFEEMINNRNKSVVKDMVWDAEGQKICIVYEDGAVIVGSVDGNRIWGKDLKGMQLTNVQWSPDGKLILFGVLSGEVHVYDCTGSHISMVNIQCLATSTLSISLAGICWYPGKGGYVESDCPCLAICFKNGRLQIMRHEADDNPVLVDTCINVVSLEWNHNGSMLAVAGTAKIDDGPSKECNVVQFYTPFGQHLRSLKVPGKQISCCSWEGGGLRIALAVDSFIYFANVRPDYKWCYFTNTVVYTYHKPDRTDVCVVFWDVQGKGRHVKYVKKLISMEAEGEYCVLSTKTDDDNGRYALVICNAIGTPIDSKYVDIEPLYLVLTSNHIVAASSEHFLIWQYRTPQNNISAKFKETAEKVYHIDDMPTGLTDTSQDLEKLYEAISQKLKVVSDPICALCASDKTIILSRESGVLQQYSLPNVALIRKVTFTSRPHRIALNCNATRLAVMDVMGNLSFVELEAKLENPVLKSDRKDVWDMKWSAENPELFAVVEKTRMYVLKMLDPEEPITSSGYICSFEDLQIRTVLLDEILQDPENPLPTHLVDIEVKSLRDTRDLLKQVGIQDAMSFIEDNSHPRLWRLLGEAALEKLDMRTSENAFVRCKDYPAIEFIKRLENIQNDKLKHAEVAAYFKRYDEAERLYIEMDRRDLAVGLRRKLGDWFQVVQLLKCSSAGDDVLMEEAWNAIGDHFAERQKWEDAVKYYEQGCNQEMLSKCYYILEDYDNLKKLADSLSEGHKLLPDIANCFTSVGMCEQAVSCYIKSGKVKAAIDCCVHLNHWNTAIDLAERHNIKEIAALLAKYARHLLDKNKVMSAVELYHKAGRFLDAARLLSNIVKIETKRKTKPLVIKKIYVLIALLVEEYHQYTRNVASSHNSTKPEAKATLIGLLEEEAMVSRISDTKLIDSSWRGAEAYHFYLLAQRQLYAGQPDAAMKTALHLQEYDNILDPEEVCSLLALASCANEAYGNCSKAFIKLQSLHNIPLARQQIYDDLAMEIFMKHSPKNAKSSTVECPTCDSIISNQTSVCPSCDTKFIICISSGRPLHSANVWTCNKCKHSANSNEMISRMSCPLCHTYKFS